MPIRAVAIGFVVALSGCSTNESDEIPPCEFTEDEISLDFEIQTGGPNGALVPIKILATLTPIITGELEYHGGVGEEWFTATPPSGQTTFTSSLSLAGPVIWSRVPDITGDHLLRCQPSIRFPVDVDFRTDDGVFNETWSGVAVSEILTGGSVSLEVESDPEEQFMISYEPTSDSLESKTYNHTLRYGTCLEGCDSHAMTGDIRFRGVFPATRDGDIIDQNGINITLAEWTGSSAD